MRTRSALLLAAGAAGALAAPAVAATTTTTTPAAPAPARPVSPPRSVTCERPGSTAPPSQALLGALDVLRRPAAAQDALPADVLAALKARGLAPSDPASARLLRTTPAGGKAWIVPVPDVGLAGFVPCGTRTRYRPQEGVVVAATGDAPAGGGAALADLVRGRGQVSVDTCAGPGRDMLGVSGTVPDGVGAAYLTAPDGTAVRADVADNGYAFVVPRATTPEQRYVVWTGGDGTPHVQPVPAVPTLRRVRCATPPASLVRVTPNGLCNANWGPVLVPPATPRRPTTPPSRTRTAPARPAPVPVPMRPVPAPAYVVTAPCAVVPLPAVERPPVLPKPAVPKPAKP